MSYALKGKKCSATGKRLDCTVVEKDWLGTPVKEFQLRVVGRVEMEEEDIARIADEVLKRFDQRKKKTEESEWAYLPLKSYNGNAYIKMDNDE